MRKKLKVITFCMLLVASQLVGCGSKMYSSGEDGYSTISFIDGVNFDVVSSVARNATAITNISEEMQFEQDQTYLFKDGESKYFLFNMASIVFIAEKGTTFDFKNSTDKKQTLENDGNIMGIWFDCPKKKISGFQYEEKNGVYKAITSANAQVSLTNNLYNDFAGRLAVISDGTTEWSLFVGTLGESFDKLDQNSQNAINYMVASLQLSNSVETTTQEEPAVSLGGEQETESNIPAETEESTEVATSTSSESDSETVPSEDSTEVATEQSTENMQEEQSEISIMLEVEETTTTEATPIPSPEPTVSPTVEARPTTVTTIKETNQKIKVYEDNKVYTSDIYQMLEVGKKGYATIACNNESTAVINVTEILTNEKALKLIKQHSQDTATSAYFNPPEGCKWQVVHYTVDGNGYVNVKLRGLDGENLRFRGIEYTQRTYDISISDTEYYSYYAIPNGCPEYALEIGNGTIDNDAAILSAYYHIYGN